MEEMSYSEAVGVVQGILDNPDVGTIGVLPLLVDAIKSDASHQIVDQDLHMKTAISFAKHIKLGFSNALQETPYTYASYIVSYAAAYAGVAARLAARILLDDAIARGDGHKILVSLSNAYESSIASTGALFNEFTLAANSLSAAVAKRTELSKALAYGYVDVYVALSETRATPSVILEAHDEAGKAVRVISTHISKDASEIELNAAVEEATTHAAFTAGRVVQATEVALASANLATIAAQVRSLKGGHDIESEYLPARARATDAATALATAVKEVTVAALAVMQSEREFFSALHW